MNRIISLSLIIVLIASCTDPNTIGLEVQPTSDNITISDTSSFSWQTTQTESEDSLRTDEALNLILGGLDDPSFGYNNSGFYTQILLTENNTDLGSNPVVDSVVISYTYSGYYGKLEEFNDNELIIKHLDQPIHKDSTYYSNFSHLDNGEDLFSSVMLNTDELNPLLQVNLNVDFAQDLFDLDNNPFVDNETFLTHFNGLSVSYDDDESGNSMLYLNPTGSNSFLKIYYSNDESGTDTLSLDFELGGDAARFSLFNEKTSESIIADNSRIYIQSMAGYKAKITVGDLAVLSDTLKGKSINKVTMSFDVEQNSQSEYTAAHDKLFLVRVNEEGNNVFLTDYTIEGETHFGGRLDNDKYEFNITRYFYQLLNNDAYTNDLYLLPAGAAVNANRTILNKDIKLTIHYSEL